LSRTAHEGRPGLKLAVRRDPTGCWQRVGRSCQHPHDSLGRVKDAAEARALGFGGLAERIAHEMLQPVVGAPDQVRRERRGCQQRPRDPKPASVSSIFDPPGFVVPVDRVPDGTELKVVPVQLKSEEPVRGPPWSVAGKDRRPPSCKNPRHFLESLRGQLYS